MDSTPNCDVVEKLLQMTGLSCNDLLIKLQQYKTRQTEKATEEKDSSLSNSSSQEEIFSDEKLCTNDKISVIREAKSCVNEVARDKDLETEISCNNHNSNDNVAIDPTIIMNKLIDVPDAVNFQDIKDLSCQDKNNKSTNSTVNEMIARDSSNKVNRQNSEDSSGSQNSKDGISTNSIVNETIKEDCSDGINFQNSDDSSSYQKDVFQSDVQCGSLQKNEAANADPIKNLHNCPSMDDHNYSNTNNNVDLEQDISTSSTDDLHKSEDNLRNIIRMQLSSLRNMKKSSTYLPDLQKRRSIFFHNLKKKRKSCDVNSVTPISVNDEIKEKRQDEENEDSKKNKDSNMNDDSLISLSDETDFVIMNVTGGVDRVTPEENTKLNITDSEERRFAVITEASKKTAIDFVSKDKIINDNNQEFSQNTTKIVRSPRKEIKNILTNYRRKMSLNYFDENRYTFASPRTEDKSKTLTVKKNISETFNEDPGINKSVKNSEKSPFISDSLEDFLNESSQLKISYSIPKLGAEEGIGERTKKSPFDNVVGKMPRTETGNEQDTPQKEKTKLIKAKTLAEMRRHFEKLKSKNKIVSAPQDIEISPLKGNPEENSNKLTSVLKYPKKITNIAPHRNSFIIYNKKKMWIPSRNKNKCVAVIDPPRRSIKEAVREKTKLSPFTPKVGQIIHRKLSLLSALNEKKPCVIKYKPGPLCRKAHLQNTESRDTWTTEIKTLPKIYFEVVPEINKPIDPCFIHLLPVFEDVVITEERTNFALSVLKLKNENVKPESFKFHVAYNNKQEKMVVRKRFQPATYKVNTPNSETNPATDVANVLNDIIRYIELKEIEDTLIKEDDTIIQEEEQKVNDGIVKAKTRKLKRKKLDLELLRLNCKVIDVATNIVDDKECTKPYCKMGCVCKSLLCESIFSNHCQLVECMFECSCPPAPANEIITTNNSLSAHTVNHLEDKAKKNLAKVEREFTQTLIHTDNDVILVGTGGRNRTRTSKVPKKYTDYIGDIDEIFDSPKQPIQVKEKIKVEKCTVDVLKLNLDNVIPYCLFHNMYNCFCKGEIVDWPAKIKTDTADHIPKIRIVKTKEDQHKSWYNSCARIRKVFPEYKARNKDPLYNQRLRAKSFSKEIEPRLKDVKRQQVKEFAESNVVVMNADKTQLIKKPSKRKQSFNIREDVVLKNKTDIAEPSRNNTNDAEKEYALQRRKKKLKPNAQVDDGGNSLVKYCPIFDGEIRLSVQDNQDILEIVGEENASLEYLRILPWSKVIESFRSGKLKIWGKEKPSSTLMCNAAGYFPPKSFVDIRNVQQKSDIINWILTDNLPVDRPREQMHLVLTPKKNHFLISGFSLKKPPDSSNQFTEKSIYINSEEKRNNTVLQPTEFLPTCVKLEPAEFSENSSPEQYFESHGSSFDQTLETRENIENAESTEYHNFKDNNTEQIESKIDCSKKERLIKTETNLKEIRVISVSDSLESTQSISSLQSLESNINVKPGEVISCLKIRPVSLSQLLEPKLKQMQTNSESFTPERSASPTISISELLASSKNVSNPSTLESETNVHPVKSVSNREEFESRTNTNQLQFVSYLKKLESRTSLSQTQPITASRSSESRPKMQYISSVSNLETKTDENRTTFISSPEQSKSLSLLESKSNVKKIQNVDSRSSVSETLSSKCNIGLAKSISRLKESQSKTKMSRFQIISSLQKIKLNSTLKPMKFVSNQELETTTTSLESSTHIKQMQSNSITKLFEPKASTSLGQYNTNLKKVNLRADEAPFISNPELTEYISDPEIFESRTNPKQIQAVSVLKSLESRTKQLQSVSDLEPTESKANLSQAQSSLNIKHLVSRDSMTEHHEKQTSSILKSLESSTVQLESITNLKLIKSKTNVCQSFSSAEHLDSRNNVKESSEIQAVSILKTSESKTKQSASDIESTKSSHWQPVSSTENLDSGINQKKILDTKNDPKQELHISNSQTSKISDEQMVSSLEAEPLNCEDDGESANSFEDVFSENPDSVVQDMNQPNESEVPKEIKRNRTPILPISISDSLVSEITSKPRQMTSTSESCETNSKQVQQVTGPGSNKPETSLNQIEFARSKVVQYKASHKQEKRTSPINPSAATLKSSPFTQVSTRSRTYSKAPQVPSGAEKTQSRTSFKQSVPTSKQIPSRSLKCTHKDMYNMSKTLVLTNKEFIKRKLYFVDKKSETNKTFFAPLPKVTKKFKWRMIYLNSDFSFLSFVRANYSIKYTDLMDVVKMSSNIKSTITLRNKEFSDHYKHPIFGIFCVPDYQDRLFVGPFMPLEKHNIETLRYLQGKLIDTQIFNKMVGKQIDEKGPMWLYETPPRPLLPNDIIIDITQDDDMDGTDDDVCIIDGNEETEDYEQDFIVESLLCPPFIEKLTLEELKAKKVNRYIITNIPHLGYFGACQRDSKAIEVFWPDDVRGYRFPNVTFAKNSLILYLSQIFCPVPKDFKINVIIMTHLDFESNTPVDPKYFTETKPYICGEFGIHEKDTVPSEVLEHHGVSSIDSFLKSNEHTEENDNKMIRLFGLFLMSNEELRKHPEPKNILQWASSEIYILKKLSENYESEKTDLRNIIRTNTSKIREMKRKAKIISAPSSGNTIRDTLVVTETIEINDSDEEDNQTTPAQPVFKKICSSGRIQTGSSEGRSLLKSKFTTSPGRSLLKVSETDKEKFNLLTNKGVNEAVDNQIEPEMLTMESSSR